MASNLFLLEKLEKVKEVNKCAYYKLRIWYEEIKDYEKLKFEDARVLNKLMLETSGCKRDEYRERLILGTLHIVCNFVCDSGFTAIKTSIFDVDDIINSSIEAWINILDEGTLLDKNYNYFSTMFSTLYYKVICNLFDYDKDKSEDENKGETLKSELGIQKISYDILSLILEKYIELVNLGYKIDENIFYDSAFKILSDKGILKKYSGKEEKQIIFYIYEMFLLFIKILNIDDINRITKKELRYLFSVFPLIYKNHDIFDITRGDFTVDYEKKMVLLELREFILTTNILTERQREVLIGYFNSNEDGAFLRYKELGKGMGISFQWVEMVLKKSLRKLSKNKVVQEIRRDFCK